MGFSYINLLAGDFELETAGDYYYLSQTGCTDIDEVDDGTEFVRVKVLLLVTIAITNVGSDAVPWNG